MLRGGHSTGDHDPLRDGSGATWRDLEDAREMPAELSPWEASLLEHVSAHLEEEGKLLARYRDLSERADAEYVGYLVGLILEDELRHHRLLSGLANALRERVEWKGGQASVPEVNNVSNPVKLLVATDRLLEQEQDDAKDLKRLSDELRDLRGMSVWPIVLELMEHDNERHQAILRFLKRQLDEQMKQARTNRP